MPEIPRSLACPGSGEPHLSDGGGGQGRASLPSVDHWWPTQATHGQKSTPGEDVCNLRTRNKPESIKNTSSQGLTEWFPPSVHSQNLLESETIKPKLGSGRGVGRAVLPGPWPEMRRPAPRLPLSIAWRRGPVQLVCTVDRGCRVSTTPVSGMGRRLVMKRCARTVQPLWVSGRNNRILACARSGCF